MNSNNLEAILLHVFDECDETQGSQKSTDLKLDFEYFEILDKSPKYEIIIDKNEFWSFEDYSSDGTRVTIKVGDVKKEKNFPFSMTESIEKVVKFYLNRPGITIEHMIIVNHPHGLESCATLKVKNFKWTSTIVTTRYDYTTWFNCLRKSQMNNVDIDLSGDDNMVLSEDVISSASKLRFKTQFPLPVEAILNFKFSNITLEQELSHEDFFKIPEKWIGTRKATGSKFTMKCKNFGSLKTYLMEQFGMKFEESEEELWVTLNSGFKLKIYELNGYAVLEIL